VLVLEARDRVGGRTLTQKLGEGTVDLGAQWIGPKHTRMLGLVRELGLSTFPTYCDGKKVLELLGKCSSYGGTIPSMPLVSLLDMQLVLMRLGKLCDKVPLDRPYDAPRAIEWDTMTVKDWKRRTIHTRGVSELFDAAVNVVFGAEAGELSLLHFLFYLHSSGGLMPLIETHGGAQENRVVGGAQRVSLRMAELLGERLVLGAPVGRIVQSDDGVTLFSDGREVRARYAILAVPPALAARIDYAPALPADRDQLTQRMPMGTTAKCIALYDRAFWRDEGFSGEAVSDRPPVSITYDASSHDGKQAALVGFVVGQAARDWSRLPADQRRSTVLSSFGRLFGQRAEAPSDYIEKDWSTEIWTRGCPIGIMPPGTLTGYGPALREPVGRLHFAGTETATEWCGFMEGAVLSGERAAREIGARL
jgi:monoamine oxidase